MTAFFDTNVLLYLIGSDEAKADKAEKLLVSGGITSVQALNEITNVCTRKWAFDPPRIREILALVRGLVEIVPLTLAAHDIALHIWERYRLSIWDSNMLACGLLAGCEIFWSEDLQDGLVIDGRLTVRNPFG